LLFGCFSLASLRWNCCRPEKSETYFICSSSSPFFPVHFFPSPAGEEQKQDSFQHVLVRRINCCFVYALPPYCPGDVSRAASTRGSVFFFSLRHAAVVASFPLRVCVSPRTFPYFFHALLKSRRRLFDLGGPAFFPFVCRFPPLIEVLTFSPFFLSSPQYNGAVLLFLPSYPNGTPPYLPQFFGLRTFIPFKKLILG